MTGTASIIRADARALPLPDVSVDLIVTSPPYFALRSYQDGGEHYGEQIGAEQTPAEYIAALIDCTREWVRVLKPGGSLFVNLGDKYSGAPSVPAGATSQTAPGRRRRREWGAERRRPGLTVPTKSLLMLPERYRIAAVDQLGLIARAVVVWSKPNGLPESVTDRVRRSHEDWVHLTREPRYYSAVDEIRTPAVRDDARASGRRYSGEIPGIGRKHQGLAAQPNHPLGSLPGSVWEIATEPLRVPDHLGVDHYAAFPIEWPRRIILGWSPSGICVECGEGRRPVVSAPSTGRDNNPSRDSRNDFALKGNRYYAHAAENPRAIAGEACACTPYTDHPERRRVLDSGWQERNDGSHSRIKPSGRNNDVDAAERAARRAEVGPVREYHLEAWTPPPTRPAVTLDPFGGTGTTALVAKALGRHGISVDRSADYCRLARWRTTDPGQLAKAMRVPAPPPVAREQLDLFGGDAA